MRGIRGTKADRAVAWIVALGLLGIGSLGAASPSFGSGVNVQPTIAAPSGQTAVKPVDSLMVGGPATEGAAIVSAFLHFSGSNGSTVQEDSDVSGGVWISGGSLRGTVAVGPLPAEANDGYVTLNVTIEKDGERSTSTSNPVTIDLAAPNIERSRLVGPKTLIVDFTETVFIIDSTSELVLDWKIDGRSPLSIEGAGDSRTLGLALELDEDATPAVDYWQQIPRNTYRDRAGNLLGPANRPHTALDKILPKVPKIDRIGGLSATDTVVANDETPEVEVGSIREGHVAEIYLESDGSGSLSDGDPMVGESIAGAGGALVTTGDLGPDGSHKLYAVARDPHDNRSGPSSASFRLDTVAPVALFGIAEDGRVSMHFSEAIVGADEASRWSITHGGLIYPVGGVSGSGDTRVLQANVPAGATVTYTPGAYTDKAGNGVETFTLDARDGIPPLVEILEPAGTVYTAGESTTIAGTSEPGAFVEVLRDGESAPVASERLPQGGDGSFSFDVPLRSDESNGFTVRATDDAGNVSQGTRAPDIVNDRTEPSVSLTSPGGGEVLRGGAITVVRWNAQDANFSAGPIRIMYSADSGVTWTTISPAEANDGVYNWTVPAVSTEAGLLRIEATDRMGLSDADESSLFRVDASPPKFDATTIDSTHVRITFSEPVTGTSAADEWRIDGTPVVGLSQDADEMLLEVSPMAAIDPNEQPLVAYVPTGVPGRQIFADAAGNEVPEAARSVEAKDGIAPAAPQIDTIHGQAAGSVRANDATPEVRMSGLGRGDTALVFVEADGASGLSEGDPLVGQRSAADDGTAAVTTSELGPDGSYTLYAASRDPNNNRSSADSVSYDLDTVAPVALYARTNGTDVLVGFSEPVFGVESASQWSIGGGAHAVRGISGGGDTRTLDAPGVPEDTSVAWTPPASEGYADAAGNAVRPFSLSTLDQIPPLVTITSPASATWTADGTFELTGVAYKSELVQVYADAGNDGTPDGEPLTVTPGSDGAFSVPVGLSQGAANDFLVRGIRPSKGLEGPLVDVPTVTQDADLPTATLTAPVAGAMLAGGRTTTITWEAADRNFGGAPISLEYSMDGGGSWHTIVGATQNDGSHDWQIPGSSTDAARVRMTATDLAGRTADAASGDFVIDAEPPVFEAITMDATHVLVTFSEAVDGSVDFGSRFEWWIGDSPAGSVTQIEGADGSTSLILQTWGDERIGPNDRPMISYEPITVFGREAFHDGAGNVVPQAQRQVQALDGIVPGAPTVQGAGGPTRRLAAELSGTATPEAGSIVIATRTAPSGGTWSAPLAADGTFKLPVGLARDVANRFDIQVRDPNGNLSEARALLVEQDGTKPRIKVTRVQQRRVGRRLVVRIRWVSKDRFPGTVDIGYVLAGSRKVRAIKAGTPDDGELVWRVPARLRHKLIRIAISATDEAGNTGKTRSRAIRLR